jgi:carbamoyltransferase
MNILGISAFYHDSAAALVRDGEIIAAAQEERFTRIKHDNQFPSNAVDYCLEAGELTADKLDYVVFYEKPLLKFERLFESYIGYAPRGFKQFLMGMPLWLRQKLHLPREMDKALGHKYKGRYVFTEHHPKLHRLMSAFKKKTGCPAKAYKLNCRVLVFPQTQ